MAGVRVGITSCRGRVNACAWTLLLLSATDSFEIIGADDETEANEWLLGYGFVQ